ncbi:DUF1002 domain-containing protein [Thermoflavimicrobium dichotomicum]|uniref:Uncharacterized protein YpuA, DUF1002 family n=1 Tax=Thermoflavimicrobium dichotomicum TaxID=46223 RepID=A0A1I3L5H5_9BACL|nr:DUF1002 domain-containing protein [Thermoflavimicrobium dichotomicum]SFI79635.1 Uncharacterized protein YpuA, DUF1002 family [Thermoflavimicrobium dichotomicum]
MKQWKKLSMIALSLIMALAFLLPGSAFADQAETVVTLGKDLTQQQRDAILKEMNVDPSKVQVIDVTNQEEHQYLGKYLDKQTIGTKAISSAKISLNKKEEGILVETKNITTVTESMYANAAITAGIKDADIYVTAPFPVSGTAGLTGIIKAFEQATGQKIDENKKQVASEEIVRTADLAKEIGDGNKAAQFIKRLKEEIAKQQPQTAEEFKNIIINISNEFNINLNNETINQLVVYAQNFANLNIDFDQLSDQLSKLRGEISNVLQSKEAQGIIDSIIQWFEDLFNSIGDFFSSK